MEKETICIRKDKLQELYKILTHYPVISKEHVYSEMCKVFGKDVLKKSLDVRDRVKTFDDACQELEERGDDVLVRQYHSVVETVIVDANLNAYLKLCIVCAALNEGWEPQFTKGETRYYPWFWLYTKDEIDEMSADERMELNMTSTDGYQTEYAGFAYASSINSPTNSPTYVGARLCLKSDTLAKYCGRQFTDIWADFLLFRKGGEL